MKRAILIAVSVLLVLGLVGYSAYVYEYYRQPSPTLSASQAVKQRNEAQRLLALHTAVDKVNLDNANSQITTLNSQKSTLCQQIKAAKLVQPLCN